MRHLYAAASEPGVSYLIDKAKTYERRRCNHLPEDYPVPLSTKECLAAVVDAKDTKTNKHRYVVASQELEVRKHMRGIMGVPLVYINRSVMIMEPMAGATADDRDRGERQKFRDGLKGGRGSGSLKRKREEDDGTGKGGEGEGEDGAPKKSRSRRQKGPKGPNPLSVKKPKKKPEEDSRPASKNTEKENEKDSGAVAASLGAEGGPEPEKRRKRRRKHKSGGDGAGQAQEGEDGDDGED
jgi:U3 small nucleolar RNA-associated protein 23